MILVVLAVGCGGSDDQTMTQASYVKQADRICKEGMKEQSAAIGAVLTARRKSGQPTNNRSFLENLLVNQGMPPLEQMVEELSALDTPEQRQKEASAMVASFRNAIDQIKAKSLQALDGGAVFAPAKEQAAALGLKVCSRIY